MNKNKIETLLDAVDETDMLKDVEMEKISVLLQQLMNLIEEYGKSEPAFFMVADGNFIRTLTDITFDYVWEVKKRIKELNDFLNEELEKQRKETAKVFIKEVA